MVHVQSLHKDDVLRAMGLHVQVRDYNLSKFTNRKIKKKQSTSKIYICHLQSSLVFLPKFPYIMFDHETPMFGNAIRTDKGLVP